MNPRSANLILTALVLGLLGTIGYMAYLMQQTPVITRSDLPTRVVTNTVTQVSVRKVYPTNFLASLGKLPVSWDAIESTNYHTYIANLRAINCPMETIRDIILTDVAKLYSKRRAAIQAQGQPFKFWETGDAWENRGANNPAVRKQLQDLEAEEQALIKDLLGVDLHSELAKYWNADDEQERIYGFLSQDKRDRVSQLQTKYQQLEQEIYAGSKGVMLDEDREKLKRLQKAKEAELAGVLSAEEFEEYELRASPTANGLRSQMSGFQPTEEEFRKIFRLQKVFDNDFNQAFDSTDDTQVDVKSRAQQDAQEALNAEIKKNLGDARYNQWARAQDGDYKALTQMAERFQLPQETTDKIYQMKQEAEKLQQRIDNNPNLTDQQRATALAGVAKETEKSVSTLMGDGPYRAYKKAGGAWIQNLGISAVPPEPEQPQPLPQTPPQPPFPLLIPGAGPFPSK